MKYTNGYDVINTTAYVLKITHSTIKYSAGQFIFIEDDLVYGVGWLAHATLFNDRASAELTSMQLIDDSNIFTEIKEIGEL